ncbi:MAG: hypothetical protein DMF88_03030 [Acidobacteria bacterium]|nr:MAG: hypothetical protein DMF88_03030 [Acidobacteriota bacterium]
MLRPCGSNLIRRRRIGTWATRSRPEGGRRKRSNICAARCSSIPVTARPATAEAYNNLGIALASQGELEKAIDQFRQALRLQPGFVDAQQNLAKLRGLTAQH